MPDFTDLVQILQWLATSAGAPYAVMYLVSLLAENWAGWTTLPRAVKFLVPMVLSVVVGVGANLLLGQADLLAVVAPWFSMVMGIILAYLGSQSAFMKAMGAKYGARFRG